MYQPKPNNRRGKRRGQTMILLAVVVIAMLGVLGLVLDGGRIYLERRRAQAAADAGAMAAAQELRRGVREYSTVRAAAVTDTGLNGYNDNNSTIGVHNPPQAGSKTTDNNFAEVTIQRNVATTFMRAVGATATTVNARAVAGLLPDDFFCIYALDPTRDGSFTNNGTSAFEANCGIMVNSNEPEAFRGSGTGACTKARIIAITGGYSIGCGDPSRQTPPETGIPAVPDPLAHLPEPDPSGMPLGSFDGPKSARTYYPGVYPNGIRITSGTNAVLMPGMYYIQKGLQFSGGTVTGTGVTFFIENYQGNDVVSIAAAASVTVSAPKSGTYMGILFFGDRDAPFTPPNHNVARGSSGTDFTGTFYFPAEHVDFAGTPASSVGWTIVVTRTMDYSGDTGAAVFNPPPPDENPLLVPVMVE